MSELFEFDVVFALPEGEASDPYELSDAVIAAGFDDAVIGSGHASLLAVSLEAEGESAEEVILEAARRILEVLPQGTRLREVRPDLVSLADVAQHLDVRRQALQKRRMPPPSVGGLYRVTEVDAILSESFTKRKGRFKAQEAKAWFAAGRGAQRINACLVLGEIDPVTLDRTGARQEVA